MSAAEIGEAIRATVARDIEAISALAGPERDPWDDLPPMFAPAPA